MKFNIQNQSFLQSASVKNNEMITFVDKDGAPTIYKLSGDGDIEIICTVDGEETRRIIPSPVDFETLLNSDAETQVTIIGKVTKMYCDPGPGTFTNISHIDLTKARSLKTFSTYADVLSKIDVTKCLNLEVLSLNSCQLSSIDVTKNTKLTELCLIENNIRSIDLSKNLDLEVLELDGNYLEEVNLSKLEKLEQLYIENGDALKTIYAIAKNYGIATSIANYIRNSSITNGTVHLRTGDAYNSEIESAATEKGWEISY